MQAFAALLDRVQLSNSRNAKLRLVRDFLRDTPDPERGWALAALTGDLTFDSAKPAMIRKLVEQRMDPVLLGWSYDFVGDLADTVALVWPAKPGANREPDLQEVVDALRTSHRAATPALLEGWLDACDADSRWALLKLLTRELRVGLSARLAKTAAADLAPLYGHAVDVSEIEEVWHAVEPPYAELFAWLEGRGPRPDPDSPGRFRPVMLAQPLDEADLPKLDPAAYAAEWKWDGIRVQAVREGGVQAMWSRTGDEISRSFPDLMAALHFDGVIDGELLVMRPDEGGALRVAPFGDMQQRLNRKAVDAKTMAAYPAAIRAYDLLSEAGEDLRGLSFAERRRRLEAFVARHTAEHGGGRMDLSPVVPFETWEGLAEQRANPPEGDPSSAEGLMLKRWDSVYESGRPKGPWFKWKRDPFTVDAVGFGLVLEVAFEGLQRSTRHKSGVAMRFPRIARIRWDKPAAEADEIGALEQLLEAIEAGRAPGGPAEIPYAKG